jgi:hypothetical protein
VNELDLLARLRDEVPLSAPSPGAQRAFRDGLAGPAGLADGTGGGRPRLLRHRPRRPRGFSPLLAGATALAVGVTAGAVVLALPSGRPASGALPTGDAGTARATPTGTSSAGTSPKIAGTTRSAQLLADTAANRVLSQPAVQPTQWVYRQVETYRAPLPSFLNAKFKWRTYDTENTWTMADGDHYYTTGNVWGLGGDPTVTYAQLYTLPANPVALDAFLAHQQYPGPNATIANKATSEFSGIEGLLIDYVLPPRLTAELYRALADIPTVIGKKNVKDIFGQTGDAFILPQNGQSVNQEIFLSQSTYQVIANADWETGGHWVKNSNGGWSGPVPLREQAFLKVAFVSGKGKLP